MNTRQEIFFSTLVEIFIKILETQYPSTAKISYIIELTT